MIFNMVGGSSGGIGYQVIVRHCGANALVTARQGNKQEIASANPEGVVVFEKLSTGVWTFTSDKLMTRRTVEIRNVTETSFLPSEYTEVEYLESTGTQHILTDFIPNNTSGVYLKAAVTSLSDAYILGCRQTTSGNDRWYIGNQSTGAYMGFVTNEDTAKRRVVGTNVFVAEMNWMNSRTRKVDGTITQSITSTLPSISRRAALFACNLAGTINLPQKVKIYACRFSDGTDVKHDFIPCYRTADRMAGMYDIVEGKFFDNNGTGEFIVGDDIPTTETLNALIICTAPIGSTVTATNGAQTFKAVKTLMGENEIHVIRIKPEYFSANPITVTCVKDDGTSTTQEAVIDSKKDVELNFDILVLFDNGRGSDNWSDDSFRIASGYTADKWTKNPTNLYVAGCPGTGKSKLTPTKKMIELGKYSRLYVIANSVEYSLDVSAITQSLYIILATWSTNEIGVLAAPTQSDCSGNRVVTLSLPKTAITITKIWLEE